MSPKTSPHFITPPLPLVRILSQLTFGIVYKHPPFPFLSAVRQSPLPFSAVLPATQQSCSATAFYWCAVTL
jgi:hypothetical protein